MKTGMSIFISTLATWLVYFLGGWDIALQTLLLFVVLDYVTGLGKAGYNKKLNSTIGLKRIIKKLGYFVVIALAVALDRIVGMQGGLRTLVIYFFVANEGLSILENWGSMGLPLPKKLFEMLEQLKSDNDSDEELDEEEEETWD